MHGTCEVDEAALRRLKSISGQVGGIHRMIEDGKYCIDVITQISAARAALNKVGMMILERHIQTCVSEAITSGGDRKDEIIEELMAVLSRGEI